MPLTDPLKTCSRCKRLGSMCLCKKSYKNACKICDWTIESIMNLGIHPNQVRLMCIHCKLLVAMKSTNIEHRKSWGKGIYDLSGILDDYPNEPRNTKEGTIVVIEEDGKLTNASFPFAYYNPFNSVPGKLKNFN